MVVDDFSFPWKGSLAIIFAVLLVAGVIRIVLGEIYFRARVEQILESHER